MMRCRFCGCTDIQACMTEDGPCYWHRSEYCSACADKHAEQLVAVADPVAKHLARRNDTTMREIAVGGRPFLIEIMQDAVVTVTDHIGLAVFQMAPSGEYYLAPHYDALELAPLFTGGSER